VQQGYGGEGRIIIEDFSEQVLCQNTIWQWCLWRASVSADGTGILPFVPKIPIEVAEHDDLVRSTELALYPFFDWDYLLLQNPAVSVLVVCQVPTRFQG